MHVVRAKIVYRSKLSNFFLITLIRFEIFMLSKLNRIDVKQDIFYSVLNMCITILNIITWPMIVGYAVHDDDDE